MALGGQPITNRNGQLNEIGPTDKVGKDLRAVALPHQNQRTSHDEADSGVDDQSVGHR